MSYEASAILERLLRNNGLGRMIDIFVPRDRALPSLLERLEQVEALYGDRIHVTISFAPNALEAEAALNPHKVRAFLQALGTNCSVEMLVMVWRILQGLSIREVVLQNREQEVFDLLVVLARPGTDRSDREVYRSRDFHDVALLQHFGIATVDGKPLFDGFYPIRHK